MFLFTSITFFFKVCSSKHDSLQKLSTFLEHFFSIERLGSHRRKVARSRRAGEWNQKHGWVGTGRRLGTLDNRYRRTLNTSRQCPISLIVELPGLLRGHSLEVSSSLNNSHFFNYLGPCESEQWNLPLGSPQTGFGLCVQERIEALVNEMGTNTISLWVCFNVVCFKAPNNY